jgi:hypothetical protein
MTTDNNERRLLVSIQCPHGHPVATSFARRDLEGIAEGTVKFYCFDHDEHWTATAEQRANMARLLSGSDAPV